MFEAGSNHLGSMEHLYSQRLVNPFRGILSVKEALHGA